MFVVRSDQLRAFEQSIRVAFEKEMVLHCKQLSPHLHRTLGDDELRLAVQQAIGGASAYGFTNRGPVRLYIDMALLFGSGFDTDPQYPWASALLTSDEFTEQAFRADALHEKACEYLAQVDGPGPVHTRAVLLRLAAAAASEEPALSPEGLTADALRWMEQAHPEKFAATGAAPLERLVASAVTRSQADHGFKEPSSVVIMALLMFTFGHQCDRDPFHAWIGEALRDRGAPDRDRLARELAGEAAARLEAAVE